MPLTDQPIKKYNHNLTQPYDKQLSADKKIIDQNRF